ncbi:DUF6777 domain-containing protein [Streptomyces sp. CA-135486]|uniref:DUF6777 domain-containing protein n=1 Tax=Streptomyces sp. CA-135486 TaxID=3240049 RepID=UPI003D8CB371
MSAEPPPNGRPTGPPSGPLSGPSQPGATPPPPTSPGTPTGPPSVPPGGAGPGGPGKGPGQEPGGPWWRSVPRIAAIAITVAAAVVLIVVFTRPGGGGTAAAGEIVRDPVNSAGEHPFTPPSTDKAPSEDPPAPPARNMKGSDAGVYGGTQQTASCNVEKQVGYLAADPAKNSAFASVLGIGPAQVPGYLRGLTPLRLNYDTRVTNHGYENGRPTTYQSVLQAGTAVLVDNHGVPRVRCACGNPLTPPVEVQGDARLTGPTWSGFKPTKIVYVQPSITVINVFIVYDPHRDDWFERKHGDHDGRHDKKIPPPPVTRPPSSPSPDTSSPPTSPGETSQSPCPPQEEGPCPPSSPPSPETETPSSESTTSGPPPRNLVPDSSSASTSTSGSTSSPAPPPPQAPESSVSSS